MFDKREYLDSKLNDLRDNPKFNTYYEFLIQENKHTNLTRITEMNDVYYKHFYDSIVLSRYVDLKHKTFLDVGAGAGFPSVPLKSIEDSLNLTIIDSLNKRIKFLYNLTKELDINSCNLIHGRAEELKQREHFDFVTSRAVARLNILLELTLPFVKENGYFIAYKSINYKDELDDAMNAIEILGGKLERVEEYKISEEEKRVLIFIKKVKKTHNEYPRLFGKIKKNPL